MRTLDRRFFLERAGWLAGGAVAGGLVPRWLGGAGTVAMEKPAPAGEGRSPEEAVKELGLTLPTPRPTPALLAPAVRVGDLLVVSGQVPTDEAGKYLLGKLGKDATIRQGVEAARRVGLTTLGVVRQETGSLNRVVRLVRAFGMVNCTPEFTEQPQVINGFSNLMIQVFGDRAGKGARCAVGMASLPFGVAVEIESVFQVRV